MAEKTAIEWTDATWSPWEGCTKVSPGCDNCYAAGMNRWLRKAENWGPGAPRRQYSAEHYAKPIRWDAAARRAGERLRVFPSVCDPFDNEVDPQRRADFFGSIILQTPNIDWLLLTKRIGNAASMIEEAVRDVRDLMPGAPPWPWPNVWLGATVVNQAEADRDIPKLLALPARVRFLSIEPMLGPVDLSAVHAPCDAMPGATYPVMPNLDWVIGGFESGPHARPGNPVWARSLRDQCAAASTAFLWKQNGEWRNAGTRPAGTSGRFALAPREHDGPIVLTDNYPRQFAAFGSIVLERVGKAAAGRLLDGVEHNGFPGPAAMARAGRDG